jgi:hypothetical protein
MYAELYSFLIQHKQLHVPGVGTFLLQRKSAQADFLNKCIHAPSYSFSFQTAEQVSSKKIFSWLADALNISDRDAVVRLNDFGFDLKKKLDEGNIVNWKGVGTLEKQNNLVRFLPEENISVETPVTAGKIIREHAKHTVLVGEQEMTSTEMEVFLNPVLKIKSSRWWILPLIIFVLAAGFIVWYFYENGLDVSNSGSRQKINIEKFVSGHQMLNE